MSTTFGFDKHFNNVNIYIQLIITKIGRYIFSGKSFSILQTYVCFGNISQHIHHVFILQPEVNLIVSFISPRLRLIKLRMKHVLSDI